MAALPPSGSPALDRLRREQPFAGPNGPFENVHTPPPGFWARYLPPTRETVRRQQDETDRLYLAGDRAAAHASLACSARLIDELDHAHGAHDRHPPLFGVCLPCDMAEAARLGAFLAMADPSTFVCLCATEGPCPRFTDAADDTPVHLLACTSCRALYYGTPPAEPCEGCTGDLPPGRPA